MKTEGLFYAAPNRVELLEYDIDPPDLYEVQVELMASGLCAWDTALFQGHVGPGTTYPFLHGHEGAGIVRRVGARVTGFAEGDRVCARGNDSKLLGHHANVPQQYVAHIPADVSDYALWIAEPVACVCNGLEWCHLLPGERVAVIGTGFMGLMFVQALGRHSWCQELIAVDVDDRRLAMARQFGADWTINPASPSGLAALQELQDHKLDLTIECAGNQAAFEMAYRLLRRAGRMNLFSAQRGEPRQVDLAIWHGLGIQVYATSPSIASDFASIFHRAVGLMEKGTFDLRPLITHRALPQNAQALFETAVAKTDGYIKGVIAWR